MHGCREKDIAIIGMGFKLPGANDPATFQQVLLEGRDCVREAPDGRLPGDAFPSSQSFLIEKYGKIAAGFLDDTDRFDAEYFNIPPAEAALLAPRQRLFLETAVTALDTSGYGGTRLSLINTGVFVGTSADCSVQHGAEGPSLLSDGTRKADAMIANRVSHFLDLRGPSKTIDTLCSSTLVAIHEACRSIRFGECQMAIAGGINLISLNHIMELAGMGLLSLAGICRSFDAKADGFVSGEGVGAFLLKPLKSSLQDRDRIWGVIKGSSVNHNGRTENIMMPDAGAITRVVVEACEDAEITPADISYIETNGTGAILGDAVEVRGLKHAFMKYTDKNHICGLGAVKTQIGNLEAASGVGAMVKVLLAMKCGQIPSNLHFEQENPLLKIEGSPFYLCNTLHKWQSDAIPRRAGIIGCGIGGVNCHIVIEESPQSKAPLSLRKEESETEECALLCLSARSLTALMKMCKRYLDTLTSDIGIDLHGLCMTHNIGRTHFEYGIAIVARRKPEITKALKQILQTDKEFWSKLENVYFNPDHQDNTTRKRGGNGFFSDFLKHFKGENRPRLTFHRRSAGIVFLFGGMSDSEENRQHLVRQAIALKNTGVIPDHALGAGGGNHLAAAVMTGDFDESQVEKPVKDLGKEEAFDRFAGEIKKLSSKRYYIFISLGMTDSEWKVAAESLQQGYLTRWPWQKSENDVPVSFLADLYAYGAGIDFETFYQGKSWQTVTLPPYPFERKRLRPQGCDAFPEKTFSSPSLSSVDKILSMIHPALTCLAVQQEISSAFTEALVHVLGYKADEIDMHTKFGDFGINSIITAQLIGIVELRLGIEAAPTLFGRYNTIDSLSAHLARQYKNREELETGTLALATLLSKITLVKAGYEHFDTVRKWLYNSEIHTWLDPFFQNNLTAMEFGFFLKKGDKKTFLIIYDSTPVGICGIVDLDKGNKTGETWLVIGEHSGRAAGMSVAAGEMLCQKAFGDFNLQTLTVKIRVDNEPALSMMRYAGWREVGILFDSLRVGDSFHHRYLYQLTKTEFKARMEGSSRNDSV